jgi:hypothetical protein
MRSTDDADLTPIARLMRERRDSQEQWATREMPASRVQPGLRVPFLRRNRPKEMVGLLGLELSPSTNQTRALRYIESENAFGEFLGCDLVDFLPVEVYDGTADLGYAERLSIIGMKPFLIESVEQLRGRLVIARRSGGYPQHAWWVGAPLAGVIESVHPSMPWVRIAGGLAEQVPAGRLHGFGEEVRVEYVRGKLRIVGRKAEASGSIDKSQAS